MQKNWEIKMLRFKTISNFNHLHKSDIKNRFQRWQKGLRKQTSWKWLTFYFDHNGKKCFPKQIIDAFILFGPLLNVWKGFRWENVAENSFSWRKSAPRKDSLHRKQTHKTWTRVVMLKWHPVHHRTGIFWELRVISGSKVLKVRAP